MTRSINADTLSKVRKRYQRRAASLEREAAKTQSRAIREKLQSQANRIREYARQFTLKNLRNRYSQDDIGQAIKQIEHDSTSVMAKSSQAEREEQMGVVLLSNQSVSSVLYASTIDIWRGKSAQTRDAAILEFFGVDNMYQVLDMFSELLKQNVYEPSVAEEFYTSAKDLIRLDIAHRMAIG